MQLLLNINNEPALSWKDYIISACNNLAVTWIAKWPDWPTNGIILYGEQSCGKTHLAKLWAESSKAYLILKNDIKLTPNNIINNGNSFLYDDEEFHDYDWWFHFINLLRNANKTILIINRVPPINWNITLLDLKSRFLAFHSIEIQMPDEEFTKKLLLKLFLEKGLQVPIEVINYLTVRINRNYASIIETVEKLNELSLLSAKPLTIPFIKDIFSF